MLYQRGRHVTDTASSHVSRVHACPTPDCLLVLDRDGMTNGNAEGHTALNILNLALTSPPGPGGQPLTQAQVRPCVG